MVRSLTPVEEYCFDSLRPGKCIQSDAKASADYPSLKVSLPFDRESVSKADYSMLDGLATIDGMMFPFPSNGKVSPKQYLCQIVVNSLGFPSLQTGKCLQRRMGTPGTAGICVSLPFKRESVSKGVPPEVPPEQPVEFPFPSPGKVLSDLLIAIAASGCLTTKFPFPSNGKVLSDY